MYLMVCTRPDISYSLSALSRFMCKPREKHWRFVKQLIKYIKSTRNYALIYPKTNSTIINGFSDSDHAGDLGDRKSTSGYLFKLGECTISWRSAKQNTVAISSTEAEFISLSQSTQEAIWIKSFLKEIGFDQTTVVIHGDLSSFHFVRNNMNHNRSKHIDIRYHFIKDHFNKKTIDLKYTKSEDLCADFLTKGVNRIKHYNSMKQLNLIN